MVVDLPRSFSSNGMQASRFPDNARKYSIRAISVLIVLYEVVRSTNEPSASSSPITTLNRA